MKLTPKQEALRTKVEQARFAYSAAACDLGQAENECKSTGHLLEKDDVSIRCRICGKNLGWWCPNSPTHKCDYEHPVPNTTHTRYDEDDCRYCHQPDERK